MQQENLQQYYIVVDEQPTGPFTLDELTLHPKLTPDSLVWKPGIENWVPAHSLPELAPAFIHNKDSFSQTPPDYSRENGENQWQSGKENREQSQFNQYHNQYGHQYGQQQSQNPFANNPQYHSNHSYQNHNSYYNRYDRYQNGYRPNMRTNWLPWAIIATVVGFFASCIGAIFGIIAIVQANKANSLYARGFDAEGDAANSNARIMTIIGLVFAGIGIFVAFFFGGLFRSFSNFSYL